MFCQQCGTQIEDGSMYCAQCGARQISVNNQQQIGFQSQQYIQPNIQSGTYAWQNGAPSPKSVSFGEAIQLFFKNYVNFTGRSTKSEYWWVFLFNFLVSLFTCWIPIVGQIVAAALIVPSLALSIRRLHDTGKSWVYILMGLIPLAGVIIVIIQYCKDSDIDNQWGPAPIDR